ncbi:MAG: type IV pilus secretin PilQ [Betaproteobacteria bacterium]|nr:type IV pilus secretin PilQ [Betaproteobacteria bacterium]MBI2508804.1 type IV pilus secretin PilQ [Betaproteobacteria bacterium]
MKLPTGLISSILRVATALLLGAASVAAYAQANSIEAINVSPQAGGKVVIKVTMKQAPASPPAGFTINNPPRIAFDFPNTGSALGRGTQEVGEGDLRSFNVVQAGDRTRLVLNLARVSSYDTQIEGRALLITLQGAGAAASPAGATTTFAQVQPGDQRHALRDIDFRRGRSGEGRVVVDLSDNAVGINLRLQGKAIVIDFINTTLPKNLERRMDVTDFGTPVQIISASTQGGNSRVVIEPAGAWEHTAYQTDNRFTVEIKPQVEDADRITRGGKYKGDKLSLNFQNVEVRAVLQVIADFTEKNIITSDTVTGNLTLRLKDVPWDQALDIILQSKGLDLRETGNVVWIAPRDELATREKLALEAQQQITDLEPTRTESFQLNYQKADAFQKLLADPAQRMLSKRGSAVVDARTNIIFVQDTPARLEEVRKLIRQVDVPVRQVMIESRIVEANDDFARNLGARLGYHDTIGEGINPSTGNTRSTPQLLPGGSLSDTGFHTGQTTTSPAFPNDSLFVNLPAPAIGTTPAGVFSLILFNQRRTRFLNLELSALQVDGRGKIISSPRVVTADKIEATIEDGVEIPYLQASSSGSTSVSFRKATLSLKVKPQVTPDDNVIMNLKVNKDSRGEDTIAGPAINTKQIVTEVLVENGGTVVIGGIYIQEESSQTRKVPVLGDLPYVGFLFKQNLKLDNRRELLIFITPKILKDSLTLR